MPWTKSTGSCDLGSPFSSVPASKCSWIDANVSVLHSTPTCSIEQRRGARPGRRSSTARGSPSCSSELLLGRLAGLAPSISSTRATLLGEPRSRCSAGTRRQDVVARRGAERVDADDAVEALGVGDGEVEREVAAPGVADRPGLLEPERVEHGERVGHVRLDRVRAAGRRRQRAALGVADRREEVARARRRSPPGSRGGRGRRGGAARGRPCRRCGRGRTPSPACDLERASRPRARLYAARSTPSRPSERASRAGGALERLVEAPADARLGREALDLEHAAGPVGLQVGAADEAVADEQRQHVVAVDPLVLALVDLDQVVEAEEPPQERPVPHQVVERAEEHRRGGRAVELGAGARRRPAGRRRRPRRARASPSATSASTCGRTAFAPPSKRQCSAIPASVSAPRPSTARSA